LLAVLWRLEHIRGAAITGTLFTPVGHRKV
jgi:hypothetical protein